MLSLLLVLPFFEFLKYVFISKKSTEYLAFKVLPIFAHRHYLLSVALSSVELCSLKCLFFVTYIGDYFHSCVFERTQTRHVMARLGRDDPAHLERMWTRRWGKDHFCPYVVTFMRLLHVKKNLQWHVHEVLFQDVPIANSDIISLCCKCEPKTLHRTFDAWSALTKTRMTHLKCQNRSPGMQKSNLCLTTTLLKHL